MAPAYRPTGTGEFAPSGPIGADPPSGRMDLTDASPTAAVAAAYERLGQSQAAAWISIVPEETAVARARDLEAEGPRGRPLWGLPFAVKDNIDVAGMPTTVACPAFAYQAERTAPAVERLEAAGAVLVGKTNLDQFATGLVGTRTPYGICHSELDPRLIAGGSSAGSAVAVAAGVVPFALGTDTAGSGRVPAAANGIVGLKPSRGLISTEGVVPACRSIDCLSIFARTVEEAWAVLTAIADVPGVGAIAELGEVGTAGEVGTTGELGEVGERAGGKTTNGAVGGYHALREVGGSSQTARHGGTGQTGARGPDDESPDRRPVPPERRWYKVGVPPPTEWQLAPAQEEAFVQTIAALRAAPWAEVCEVDVGPLIEAGKLLYGGAFVAERLTTIGPLLERDPEAIHPVVREVVSRGLGLKAVELFADLHRLADLRAALAPTWNEVDALVCPTVPDLPTLDEVEADPFGVNVALGRWTNGVNLHDLCAVTVPSGRRPDSLPGSTTVIAPHGHDLHAATIATHLALPPD